MVAFQAPDCDVPWPQKKDAFQFLCREELHSVLSTSLLRFWKASKDPRWAKPKPEDLWRRVTQVVEHGKEVVVLDAKVHNAILSHNLLRTKEKISEKWKREETWGERQNRLDTFFSDMKDVPSKVNTSVHVNGPVVMDEYLRSMDRAPNSPSSLAAQWPPNHPAPKETSLSLESLDGHPSKHLSTKPVWKERSGKSRCRAAPSVWEWAQHVPPAMPSVMDGRTPSVSSSQREETRSATLLPPISGSQSPEANFEATDSQNLADRSPLSGSLADERTKRSGPAQWLQAFPELAQRRPQPTRRLVFDDRPVTGSAGKGGRKKENLRELKVYPGGFSSPDEPTRSELNEAVKLLQADSETGSQASSRQSQRRSSMMRSASDTALPGADFLNSPAWNQFSSQFSSASQQGLVESLMELPEDDFEDELWKDRLPDGTDPLPDRVFDRSFRRDMGMPVKPPFQTSRAMRSSDYGLPPIHSKGSNWDPRREFTGGYASHILKYLKNCADERLLPELLPFVTGHSSKLEASGRQLIDRDLQAISTVVDTVKDLSLVDLSDNTLLSDKSMVPLINGIMKQKGPATLLTLNLANCRAVGPPFHLKLAALLESQVAARLRVFNINGVHLSVSTKMPVCEAIKEHASLLEIHMADTRISGTECMATLLGNNTIEVLDLGWNCFDAGACAAMGELVAQNPSLRQLNLASCAASPKGDEVSPMASFFEHLSSNTNLKHLDVSFNQLDFRAALVLEDALLNHKKLARITISNNPLGHMGMRSLLRLLAQDSSGFVYMDCESVAGVEEGNVDQVFKALNPGGQYTLNLEKPYHRSLLRMLCKTAERMKIPVAEVFTDPVMGGGDDAPNRFDLPTKNTEGIWNVQSSGELSVTFSVEKGMGAGISDKWNFGDVLEKHINRVRVRPAPTKVHHLMTQWSLLKNAMDWMIFLKALSKDFVLHPAHIIQLCENKEVASEVVWNLFSCIDGGNQGRFLVLHAQPTLGGYIVSMSRTASFLDFNPDNPTGHYKFDLANPAEYFVAQRLVLLDRWEAFLRADLKRVDTSRRQNNSCFLNERYNNQKFYNVNIAQWKMPEVGVFETDYVSGKRLSDKERGLDEATLDQILRALSSSKVDHLEQVQSILRPLSHHFNLYCEQLRALLGLFGEAPREEIFVSFYLRVVDIQNDKLLRVIFEKKEEFAKIESRLGHTVLFPYMQPEQFNFEYELSFEDQRFASYFIFQMMEKEGESNLKEATFSSKGGEEDETNFWRSQKEVSMEKLPTQGVFKGTYICAPENRDFKFRKKLLETYGYWQLSTDEKSVRWWASLYEANQEVLDFVEFLLGIEKFKGDLSLAFYDIDGSVPGASVSNGSVTMKEFEEGVEQLGFDAYNKEGIMKIFRYLDPTGEGCISMGEWEMLTCLWSEMRLSVREFTQFLERLFGEKIEDWWKALDDDGSNEVSKHEWVDICRSLGYFGAVKQIFRFMDKDDEGNISFEEFKALEEFRKPPAA